MIKKIFIIFLLCLFIVGCNEKTTSEKYEEIENKIYDINEVTLESGDYLYQLLADYEALSDEDKALVKNYLMLETYIEEYVVLLAEYEKNNYNFTISGPAIVNAKEEISYAIETDKDYEFVWSVSDNDIAYIDENGLFYADFEGTVDVIATIKGTNNSQKITVTVLEAIIKPTFIKLSGDDYLAVGEQFDLKINVRPSDVNEDIIVTLSNDCADLNDGVFTALKEGTVIITATSLDGTIKDTFEVVISNLTVNEDVKLLNDVTREMTAYQYWTKLYNDVDDVILTLSQIEAKNNESYLISGTKLVDIVNSGTTISGSKVKALIENYKVNSSHKINGQTQDSGYADLLYSATNKAAIPTTVSIKFGLVNEFAAMRSFPTYDVATNSSSSFDRYQETGVEVGEGCLIYHESLDGNWYFVQTKNYCGWVEKQFITIVTQDEMKDYLTNESFVVVTALETNIDDIAMRMGSKIIVTEELDSEYVLKLITKDGFKTYNVNKNNADLHYGYLEYTKKNILVQIFKLLGNPYRWGDSDFGGHDCSSTMNAVYHCMGFVMPRNTSNQYQIPYTLYDVTSDTDTEKKAILDELQVGSLVFVSGHVMMYLGKVGDNYYIIHNFSSGGGCNISTTSLIRSGSTTYLTAFTYFVEIK